MLHRFVLLALLLLPCMAHADDDSAPFGIGELVLTAGAEHHSDSIQMLNASGGTIHGKDPATDERAGFNS